MKARLVLFFSLLATTAYGQADRTFNFRCTSAFVTDGPGETFVAQTHTYTAAAGYGWLSPLPAICQDRDAAIDRRLAGFVVNAQNAPSSFQYDVPAGEYEISLALGDAFAQRPGQKAVLMDAAGNTLISMSVSTLAGEFADANGVVYSAAQWPVMATAKRVTVAQGPLTLTIGTNVEPRTRLTHFGVKRVTAQNQAPTCTVAQPGQIIAPGAIGLVGSGSDSDGPAPLTYQWLIPSTLSAAGVLTDQPTLTIPASVAGNHQVELRCSDGALTTTTLVQFTVLPVPVVGIPMIQHTVNTSGAERVEFRLQNNPRVLDATESDKAGVALPRQVELQWRRDVPFAAGLYIFEIWRYMPGNPMPSKEIVIIQKQ